MKDFNINYPVVHGDLNITNIYGGINSIPTSFVIDKDGYVVSRYQGLVEKSNYVNDINKIIAKGFDREKLVKAPEFELPLVK